MIVTTLVQPPNKLGEAICDLLLIDVAYEKITLVSAFVASRTILRFREELLQHVDKGAVLQFILGIDLSGTSLDVLEELNTWPCKTYIFHNAIPRSTFHPKIYLFQTTSSATVFIGSNNLTDGGFYTNYEAAVRYDFTLPTDQTEYKQLIDQLKPFLEPKATNSDVVHLLDANLINTLVARGELLSEVETKKRRANSVVQTKISANTIPNPFASIPITKPLALQQKNAPIKHMHSFKTGKVTQRSILKVNPKKTGKLVWQKTLSQSDALQVNKGSAHVGGIRLTQAKFHDPVTSQPINQTTYFRQLFDDYIWEAETGRHRTNDQEHAFIPVRIIILGDDYGVHNFEVSHKPSGEAGQGNYTTILRWGRIFNPIIQNAKLTGCIFYLFQAPNKSKNLTICIDRPQGEGPAFLPFKSR